MPDTYHVLCGDRRQRWAAEELRDRGFVAVAHGVPELESWPLPEELSGSLVLPFPSFQGSYLRGKEGIAVSELLSRLKPGTRVYGALLDAWKAAFEKAGAGVFDLYGSEPLTTLNAIPTAEGAIRLAIDVSPLTLHGAKCLVIGFGRVGRVLAQKLHVLSADVTVSARKAADRAMAQALGMRPDTTGLYEQGLGEFDFIFNTVPAPVLSARQLALLKPACILIELASKPGGIPEDACRELGLSYHFAPGLPGLCAPETAGRLYAGCILACAENPSE